MKIFVLVMTLGALMSSACLSRVPTQDADRSDAENAGNRGLPRSAHALSFMPTHLTGPNAGKKACPLCIYGLAPQIQIWAEEPKLEAALALAKRIDEALVAARTPRGTAAYLIVAGREGTGLSPAVQKRLRASGLRRVFATSIPSWTDVETGKLYGHSNDDRPGVRAYVLINRRVFARWDRPTATQSSEILRAAAEGARWVTSHDIADSTLAPAWEVGQRLEVRFRLVDAAGRPLAKTKVSGSQTDRTGLYNPRGWGRMAATLTALAWTDQDGWITWRTIMPGPYPTATEPAHIHYAATVNGRPKWRTLWFEGDPLLTAEKRAWAARDAETEIVRIDKTGPVWKVVHTFRVP